MNRRALAQECVAEVPGTHTLLFFGAGSAHTALPAGARRIGVQP